MEEMREWEIREVAKEKEKEGGKEKEEEEEGRMEG